MEYFVKFKLLWVLLYLGLNILYFITKWKMNCWSSAKLTAVSSNLPFIEDSYKDKWKDTIIKKSIRRQKINRKTFLILQSYILLWQLRIVLLHIIVNHFIAKKTLFYNERYLIVFTTTFECMLWVIHIVNVKLKEDVYFFSKRAFSIVSKVI